jgi:hypothetical protein
LVEKNIINDKNSDLIRFYRKIGGGGVAIV